MHALTGEWLYCLVKGQNDLHRVYQLEFARFGEKQLDLASPRAGYCFSPPQDNRQKTNKACWLTNYALMFSPTTDRNVALAA